MGLSISRDLWELMGILGLIEVSGAKKLWSKLGSGGYMEIKIRYREFSIQISWVFVDCRRLMGLRYGGLRYGGLR